MWKYYTFGRTTVRPIEAKELITAALWYQQSEVARLQESLCQKDRIIQERDETIREKNEAIREKNDTIQDKDAQLEQVRGLLSGLEQQMQVYRKATNFCTRFIYVNYASQAWVT